MISYPVIIFTLVQSSIAYLENSRATYNFPEDLIDTNNNEVEKRGKDFLRYGRSEGYTNDQNYNDYDETVGFDPREKNDHFIRFGRGNPQEFPQLGSQHLRSSRAKGSYLRFGRRIPEPEDGTKRFKREISSEPLSKRDRGFLRFGRNRNPLQFVYDPTCPGIPKSNFDSNGLTTVEIFNKMKQLQQSPMKRGEKSYELMTS